MHFFYFFVLISFLLSGQNNFKKLDQRVRKFVDDGELVGIQTKVIKNGEVIHYENYGYSDIDKKKSLQERQMLMAPLLLRMGPQH